MFVRTTVGTVDPSRNTVRIAVVLVLVARTDSVPPRPPGTNPALSMCTTSGGGGAAVVTVIVPTPEPSPPQHATAFTLTGVLAATRLVVTGKSTRVVLAETTTCAGTCTTAGLALVRFTSAPCVAGPLSVTLPVAGPVPPRLAGKNTTETMDGPVGAGSVVMLVAQDVPPAAAEISAKLTVVVGDVVMGNVALATPAGTMTVAGTAATAAFVAVSVTGVSGPIAEASVTVPWAGRP